MGYLLQYSIEACLYHDWSTACLCKRVERVYEYFGIKKASSIELSLAFHQINSPVSIHVCYNRRHITPIMLLIASFLSHPVGKLDGSQGREGDTSSHSSEYKGIQQDHSMPTFILDTALYWTHDLATQSLSRALATS